MDKCIRDNLVKMADDKYRDFSAALIPKSKPLLGIRLPILRKLAKDLINEQDWLSSVNSYTDGYEDIYFEEVMLRGMMIGYGTAKMNDAKAFDMIENFIPHIDNWSVCDSFCSSLVIAHRQHEKMWEFLQNYIFSEKEFEVRTALIIILDHYLKYDNDGRKVSRKRSIEMQELEKGLSKEERKKFPYLEKIFDILNREYNQGYYAQMAAAWTTAEAFVTFPYETFYMLKNDCKMDAYTYKKAIQKINESRTPKNEVKQYLKSVLSM